MIPLSVPSIKGNAWQYVKECIDTEWVSSAGKFVDRFEEETAAFTGAKHAISCVNGTSALQVSLRIAGVRPGDEVIVPALTFIAPVNAVHYLSAYPSFQDADRYYNMDGSKVVQFLKTKTIRSGNTTLNKISRRRIATIVPVHVFGNACWLDEIVPLCHEMGISVVEDATESLGTVYTAGKYKGRHMGTVGDLGCLSFNGNKIITTGGGGMILTDNPEYAEKARYLTTQAKDDEIRYVHHEVGYNFRLTNIQAALGVSQFEQLPEFLQAKKRNYRRYKEKLAGIQGLELCASPPYADNNHWMYALQIDKREFGMDREEVMTQLSRQGIQTRPVWFLNHRQRPYQASFAYEVDTAEVLWERTLNIPCSVGLTMDEMDRVVEALYALRATHEKAAVSK